MGLDQEIKDSRTEMRSDGYSMSIGELISIYRDGELEIRPEFQRFYRWSDEQKSRFVESILLGIPIPSIFVSQREDGVWEVIDGLQRMSTIFQLIGELKNPDGGKYPMLTLKPTKYLPSLGGKKWKDDDPEKSIGVANHLIIRRAKMDVKIVLRESTESSKYELFQRLNTGGAPLSEQELRNAILLMVNGDAFRWIESLSKDDNFQSCITLSDRMVRERYDMELVTRFLVFRNLPERELRSVGDIGEFVTDRIVEFAQSENYADAKEAEERAFRKTFTLLAKSLGDRSFKKYDAASGKHSGGFLISAFEPIALGVGFNCERYPTADDGVAKAIREESEKLWANFDFLERSGMGVNASTRMPANIPLGRDIFNPCG